MRVFVTGEPAILVRTSSRAHRSGTRSPAWPGRTRPRRRCPRSARRCVAATRDLDGLKEAAADSDGVIHVAHRQDLLPSAGWTPCPPRSSSHARLREALAERKPLVAAGSIGSAGTGELGRPATEETRPLPSAMSTRAPCGSQRRGSRRSRPRRPECVFGRADSPHHAQHNRCRVLPMLIALAKEKGFAGYPETARTCGAPCTSAMSLPCSAWRWRMVRQANSGMRLRTMNPFRVIAEAIGSRLGLPAVSIPADELMMPAYFGLLTAVVMLDLPASSLITRRTLGWEPAQPGLLADMDNGHYFPATDGRDPNHNRQMTIVSKDARI